MKVRPAGELLPRHRSSARRVPGIEGLRALAAGGVLLFHAYFYTQGPHDGWAGVLLSDAALGVTLFFTLSGFLLFRPYVRAALTGAAAPRAWSYLRNRALRIIPAYWVVLGVSALTLGVYDWDPSGSFHHLVRMPSLGHLVASALFGQNYRAATFATGLPHTWTLAVEVVFYLLLPLIGLATISVARRASRLRTRTAAVMAAPAVLLIVGLAGKTIGLGESHAHWWTAQIILRSFLGQADQFAFGMAVAVIDVLVVSKQVQLPKWWAKATCACLAVLAVPTLSLGAKALGGDQINTLAAVACGCGLALVVLPSRARPRLTRVLEHRLFVSAGLISYSVFLWQNQIAMWLQAHHGRLAQTTGVSLGFFSGLKVVPLNVILITVPTLILSVITYRLVELPALALKRHRSPSVPRVPTEPIGSPAVAPAESVS